MLLHPSSWTTLNTEACIIYLRPCPSWMVYLVEWLIPRSRVLLERQKGPQLVKEFPACCENLRFTMCAQQSAIFLYPKPDQSSPRSYLLTYLLTPWSRVLLEKLTGSAASQEIPRFFGTRKFITVLTSARHLSLSWANSIQSPQPPPTSWRSILILSSHLRLGLPNGLFPSGFPTTLYEPIFFYDPFWCYFSIYA